MRLQTLFRHTESTLRAGAVLALLGRSAFACASLALTFLHVCSRDVCQVLWLCMMSIRNVVGR